MAENPNGLNAVELFVPCCKDETLTIRYKTNDNGLISDIFKTLMQRIGIDVKFSEIKKGGD